MSNNQHALQSNSKGWLLFVKISFIASIVAMVIGIIFMPTDLVIKGYFALNALFIVSSTIMLSKTMRDEHESEKIINRISEAKANKIIQQYTE